MSESKLDVTRQPDAVTVWTVRVLLASLLLLGGEILLWNNPLSHSLLEWLLSLVGYVLSATVLLDLAVRYRIRSVYDVMSLMIVHVMMVALFIKPDVAFEDFPNQFILRLLGGEAFVGIEMFGMFLLLTRGNARRGKVLLVFYSLAIGFYWGIWTRWSPLRETPPADVAPLSLMIAVFCVAGLIVLFLYLRMSRGHSVWQPEQLKLGQRELGAVLIVAIGLFVLRLMQGWVDFSELLVFIILVALAIGVLYYRKPEKAQSLMDKHFPPQPIHYLWVFVSGVIVIVAGIVGYRLPYTPVDIFNQLSVLELAFTGIGFVWLPLIAIVISTEALDRQSRTAGQ